MRAALLLVGVLGLVALGHAQERGPGQPVMRKIPLDLQTNLYIVDTEAACIYVVRTTLFPPPTYPVMQVVSKTTLPKGVGCL